MRFAVFILVVALIAGGGVSGLESITRPMWGWLSTACGSTQATSPIGSIRVGRSPSKNGSTRWRWSGRYSTPSTPTVWNTGG